MAATSCFVNAFKSMNNGHEGHTVSAEDLILNMVIPTSIAGELHEEAIQKYKEEQSMRHIHHRLLQDIQLSAGSTSDGLSLPEVTIKKGDIYVTEGADVDIMYLFTSLVVDSGNRRAFCSTDSSNSPHGYTRLVFNTEWLEKRPSKNHREMSEEQMIKGAYPSFIDSTQNREINRNKLFRLLQSFLHGILHNPAMERRLTNYNLSDELQFPEVSYSRNGPAITVENTKFDNPHSKVWTSKDYVISLPCPRWPNEAAEWVIRPRLWPPKSLVRRIVKTGCLIVAKQDKEVQDRRSFLFSFSQCEKLLALNLTVLQKRCYLLFKFLFKYSINKVARGMCSFHCKTIFFRHCEVTTPDMWTDNNVLECITWLLSDMEKYLKSGCLPQYFIAGMNLFSAISQKARESILNDVAKVLASPVRTILDLMSTRGFVGHQWIFRCIKLCLQCASVKY